MSAPAPAYVNQAQASSQRDWWTDYDVEYQLEQTTAAVVNTENSATASASYCHDCGAIAIGFQILVVSKQDLTSITAHNTAIATGYSCARCNTLAAAYQIVVATNSPDQLTFGQEFALAEIQAKLETIQRDSLSAYRSQQLAGEFADEAVAILRGGPGAGPNQNGPDLTPAMNDSDIPTDLTENNGPVVNLYVKYRY